MLYNAPTGSTDPNADYVGKNVAAGRQGSKIPPTVPMTVQRELVAIITESGQTPTNDDLTQVLRAIRSGKLTTYTDISSVPNSLLITPRTPHTALLKGLAFKVYPAFANTGACQLTVGSLSAPLTRRDGTALVSKDILPGIAISCTFDGQVFRLDQLAQSEVARTVSNPILYVRPDGNDANKGDGNNAAQAFATIGAALAYGVNFLVYSGSALTIQLGLAGIYAAPATQGIAGSNATLLGGIGTVQILGDILNQDQYVIQGTGYAGNSGIIHASFGTALTLRGVAIQNNSPGTFNTITAASNSTIYLENVSMGGLNGSVQAHLAANGGGNIRVGVGCKITSSQGCMLYVFGGEITILATVTLVGALAVGIAFARSMGNGKIFCPGGAGFAGGAVTGQRYLTANGGIINVFGQGANFFPGSTAGTSTVADQYN